MTDKIVVLTTAGSEAEAGKIAHALVERRLAACVNIVPKISSVYRWQEKIEESEEWLLVIKTGQELFGKVRDAIRELHSYELPECISVAVEDGSMEYLKWLGESVG
jgi:periplasmic divalent cation tolerance protein